jgi:hypothetical protein
MSTLVPTDPLIQPVQCPAPRDHANLALLAVLDAEIEALKARLRQWSANAAVARGLARADLVWQVGWLRDSMAKLQSRRDGLG